MSCCVPRPGPAGAGCDSARYGAKERPYPVLLSVRRDRLWIQGWAGKGTNAGTAHCSARSAGMAPSPGEKCPAGGRSGPWPLPGCAVSIWPFCPSCQRSWREPAGFAPSLPACSCLAPGSISMPFFLAYRRYDEIAGGPRISMAPAQATSAKSAPR
jgi:hypothetical protein